MLTKVCRGKCGAELALISFDLNGDGKGRRNICRRCRGAGQRRAAPVNAEPEKRFTRALNSKRYLITSAQNETPVHSEFFATLKVAAAHLGAELVVIPFRYKNPTSPWAMRWKDHESWAAELAPYLHNTRKKLNANLVLAADVKIQPTAGSPLSGFDGMTGDLSCIIGHPKMQFLAVPSPLGRMAKILTTTGAVTVKNYTDTKAGKLGEFHHFLGAILVEIDGPVFHVRQLNADRVTGEFIDVDTLYTTKGTKKAPRAAGVICGDMHARFADQKVDEATFGLGGVVDAVDPEQIVFHDLFDGYSVNPHHFGDPFISHAKARAGLGDPRGEVEHAVKFVVDRLAPDQRAVIVASNHDDFLARWVRSADWKTMGPGAREFYLETAQAMLKTARMTPGGTVYEDPFRYWAQKLSKRLLDANEMPRSCVKALGRDESLKIAGVECSLHGHIGPNGARSTMKNLARIGARTVTGHAHTPGIEEGHYRVGTSTPLRLEYNRGPSSWLNTHCVIYANGKRSLITIIDGRWRLPPVKA